jgi:hypothetical protein
LKWLPWIGKNYQNTKLLVVGEEAIIDDRENALLTRNSVFDNFINNKYIIFKNIEQALFIKKYPTEEQRKSLWSAVAFYNFIQHGASKNEQPNNENFKTGWETFFEVNNILKPKYCLFYGIRALNYYSVFLNNLEKNNYSIIEDLKKLDKIENTQPRIIGIKDKNENGCKLLFMGYPSKLSSWKNCGELLKKEFGEIKKEFPPSLFFVRQRFFIQYV